MHRLPPPGLAAPSRAVRAARARPPRRPTLPNDPTGFHLDSSSLYVHENAGQAVITISRARHQRGRADPLHHARRRTSRAAPLAVHGGRPRTTSRRPRACSTSPSAWPRRRSACRSSTTACRACPRRSQVSLFGPSPIGMGSPNKAVLTILADDPDDPARPGQSARPPGGAAREQPAARRQLLRRSPERAGPRGQGGSRARRDRARARDRALRQVQLRLERRAGHPDRGVALSLARRRRVCRARCRCWPPTGSCTACAGMRRTRRPTSASYHDFIDGLRPGDRLLPGGAVPRDGLAHHDALPLWARQGGARGRAARRDQRAERQLPAPGHLPRLRARPTRSAPRDAAQLPARHRASRTPKASS